MSEGTIKRVFGRLVRTTNEFAINKINKNKQEKQEDMLIAFPTSK